MTEVPTRVSCHVCGKSVDLVSSQQAVEDREAAGQLAAFAVVPCVGLRGIPSAPTTAHQNPSTPAAPPPKPKPVAQNWVVTLANGESIQLDKDTMIIGRSRTCDVVIPSAKVSRQHASVSRINGDYYIEDLGSANGVWGNGEKVTRAKIAHGDTFTISDETLLFESR